MDVGYSVPKSSYKTDAFGAMEKVCHSGEGGGGSGKKMTKCDMGGGGSSEKVTSLTTKFNQTNFHFSNFQFSKALKVS